MSTTEKERSRTAAVVALFAAAIVGLVIGYQAVSGAVPSGAARQDTRAVDTPLPPPSAAIDRRATVDDGVVPGGVSVFDDRSPAVANLDRDLLAAIRQAATAAEEDGVDVVVTSGWRSPAYQDQLLREAVDEYGSEEEAARWVATADTSLHVSGDAVDVGHSAAWAWLAEHGAGFGLCRTYDNEPWHFELRPGAVDHGCPDTYADPTHDPRLQR